MKVGVGLPNAVPGAAPAQIIEWAARADDGPFASLGTVDRIRYDNIEPMVSRQWFVRIKPLAEPAIEAVRNGEVRITPQSWEATYFNWMENIHDWTISRQLWWGHRIPAFYSTNDHLTVAME